VQRSRFFQKHILLYYQSKCFDSFVDLLPMSRNLRADGVAGRFLFNERSLLAIRLMEMSYEWKMGGHGVSSGTDTPAYGEVKDSR
jgi:hypothetical protein